MLTLRRPNRLKARLALPDGNRICVDLDVEAHLPALIRAQNDLILAARAAEGASADGACSGDAVRQNGDRAPAGDPFYEAYRALLRLVLGRAGLNRALAACGGDLRALCAQLDGWLGTALAPRIRAASAGRVRRCRAQARRMLRRAR